jgi:hypothetical protein
MKRRLALWLGRRLLKVARGRRAAAGTTGTGGSGLGAAQELAVSLLARVWPYVDTPRMRSRGERFVTRMRSTATHRV